ncbi:WD40-repeat-containing domain protein [Dipodascopsis tothii]|uniref:WD40-repeat-containing domain protein n=1 Tax=Dipodascopsis tothii TaxID=44089 RepID=UPI0034CE0D80
MQTYLFSSSPVSASKTDGMRTPRNKRGALEDMSSSSVNRRASFLPTPDASPTPVKKQRLEFVVDERASALRGRGRALLDRELGCGHGRPAGGVCRRDYLMETQLFHSTGADVYPLEEREDAVPLPFAVCCCKQNSLAAVGDENGLVHFVDTTDEPDQGRKAPLLQMICHNNAIFDLEFSHDDRFLATSSGDQTVRVFDVQAHKCKVIMCAGDGSSVKQVAYAPGSDDIVLASSRAGIISLFDLRCPTTLTGLGPSLSPVSRVMRAHADGGRGRGTKNRCSTPSVTALAWVSERTFVSGSESNGMLKLWDTRHMTLANRTARAVAQTPDLAAETRTRDFGVTSIGVDHTGGRLWALARDSRLYSYALGAPGNQPLEILSHPQLAVDSFYVKLAVMPGGDSKHGLAGNYVACGSSSNAVVVFPSGHGAGVPGREPVHMDKLGRRARLDGRRLGTALAGGHAKEVTGVAWSQDGDLVSIGDDKTARVWRAAPDVAARDRRLARAPPAYALDRATAETY